MSKKQIAFLIMIFALFSAVFSLTAVLVGVLSHAKTASIAETATTTTETATAAMPQEDTKVTFTHQNKKYTYVQNSKTAAKLNKEELKKRGYFLSQKERGDLLKNIKKLGFTKEEAVRYIYFGIEDIVAKIEKDINKEPKDSTVKFHPEKSTNFTFTPEATGLQVARKRLYDIIYAQMPTNRVINMSVPTDVLQPNYTAAYHKANIVERASFSTSYSGSSSDRKHNVALALRFYNGLVVAPNEAISFNKLVGARTEERGFRKAKIILNGLYEDGIGGGVCQSSTTLYNAFLIAGLKILQRSPHSLTPSYISVGFDAMVSMGGGDLEFLNDTNAPIYIKTVATADTVTVKIFGEKPTHKIIRKKVIKEKFDPPPDKVFLDLEGKYTDEVYYIDEWHTVQSPKQGMVVEAYLEYYEKGKLIKTEKIHTDKYKSVQGIYVYGTHLRPPEPPPETYYQNEW